MNIISILLNRCQLLKVVLLLAFLSILPSKISAHPHAWVETNTYIDSTQTHITSLHMTWTFDTETSNYMLQGEDVSAEHINETLQLLADSVVSNMYNEHYFTYLYDGRTPIRYKAARYPQLIQSQGKLVLSFELPLSEPIPFKGKNLKLFIYDETYFVDMSWSNKKQIQVSEQINTQCSGELIQPSVSDELRAYTLSLASDVAPDNTIGQLFSQRFQLHCQ